MDQLATALDYTFRNPALLEEALTHPSCNQQRGGQAFHYQRLEFLGDSVLGLVIADLLLKAYPQEPEGALARRKAALVESKALAAQAQHWGLDAHLRLSPGEENGGGRQSQSILEDACEAIIGAVYLDGGFEAAHALVARGWHAALHQHKEAPKDPKTTLQEVVQAQGLPLPVYVLLSAEGSAHAPVFHIAVRVEGYGETSAHALSKRKAEQLAATEMLERIQNYDA